jgi:hypothetical protein
MKVGAFLMPSHPPERTVREGQRSDLEELVRLDRLGFDEAWIGEHFTTVWEPCPAPDLLIAQALSRTERIRLGPLGHLLPYHHPIELAHRVAYLDHMAEGRYQRRQRAANRPRTLRARCLRRAQPEDDVRSPRSHDPAVDRWSA